MVALALGFFCRLWGIVYFKEKRMEAMFNFKYPPPTCGDYPALLCGDPSDNIRVSQEKRVGK